MFPFSNNANAYSVQTTILKNKFKKTIMECVHSNQIHDYTMIDFFRKWKIKSDTYSNFNLSIVLQLLLSPNIYSKQLTLEYYINQLNYNSHIVEEFVNDFLVYYSIHIY